MALYNEAKWYTKKNANSVECGLCPHRCMIRPGNTGICGVRVNQDGVLVSDIYGKVSAVAMDPVEKKPLYHFYPGTSVFSIGTLGCNLKCPFCQNWHISQNLSTHTSSYTSDKLCSLALDNNSIGIAYTYNEPIIWFEFVLETAQRAREHKLKNIMVSNGFINQDPLHELMKYIDAVNIDLKSFNEQTYKKVMKANLTDVCSTIKTMYNNGCHTELTTLVVTGINDTIEEMDLIIDFIAGIDKNIPWHLSRYYPNYHYEENATDIDFMMLVYERAIEKLNFVYTGNIPMNLKGSDTVCPSCGVDVINRSGYYTKIQKLNNGKCSECGTDLYMRN